MWKIRPFQAGDEPALLQLFARVFGREITPEQYRWKLRSHSFAVENIYVAVVDETPIFHYAGIPVRYQLAGRERLAMVSVDTMASPDYRRQGLLSKVGRYSYDRWREQGVDFVIGLPNEQWGSRAAALGWLPLFPLAWYSLPLRPSQILGRKVPLAAKLTVVDRLWRLRWGRTIATATFSNRHFPTDFRVVNDENMPFAPIRVGDWYNWRYLGDSNRYQVLSTASMRGVLSWRISADQTTAMIAECSGEHWHDLMQSAVRAMFDAGAETATTQAVVGSTLAAKLMRLGFRRRPHAFAVQIVPLADDLPPLAELQQPRNWDLCGGDFDIL